MNRQQEIMNTAEARLPAETIRPFTASDRPGPEGWKSTLRVGGLAILFGVLFGGCSTGQPAPASFASVLIPNQSLEQIHATTVMVFKEAGYSAKRVPDGTMVFEKEGSRGDQIVYGGLGGAAYSSAVTVRVKAEIVNLAGQDARRLQCTAYIVNDAGQGVFEDKKRLARFRRGPYQQLLEEVAARLK